MAESEPECHLRRRRSSGNPNLGLDLDVGNQVNECGGPSQGTPSPSCVKFIPNTRSPSSSSALKEFRKKQQSFDLQVDPVEECEEEEIVLESDDEAEGEDVVADRPVTPTPIQDFAANVTYKEGPQTSDFLKVNAVQNECITDISDAEDTDEEE